MASGDGGPVGEFGDEEAFAPTCRRCLALMDRLFPEPRRDDRFPLVAQLVTDLVMEHGYAEVRHVPGDQQAALLAPSVPARGLGEEEGGYHWSGELRLWDNEILIGWYTSTDGPIRSKGAMYFVLHPHGLNMAGRWVGLGYDDQIMTGWASIGRTCEQSEDAMTSLIETEGVTRADDPAL